MKKALLPSLLSIFWRREILRGKILARFRAAFGAADHHGSGEEKLVGGGGRGTFIRANSACRGVAQTCALSYEMSRP